MPNISILEQDLTTATDSSVSDNSLIVQITEGVDYLPSPRQNISKFFVAIVTLGLGYGTWDLHCGMPYLFILFF